MRILLTQTQYGDGMKPPRILGTGCLAAMVLASGCELDDSPGPSREENTRDTAWAINYLTGHLLTTFVADRQAGSQNITIQCSRGGTISITGRTDYEAGSGALLLDLAYVFDLARVSVVATNLAVSFHPLHGTIRQSGSISPGSGRAFEDTDSFSRAMRYADTIWRSGRGADEFAGGGADRSLTSTSETRSGATYISVRGVLDGHPFSWRYEASGSTGGTNAPDVEVIL